VSQDDSFGITRATAGEDDGSSVIELYFLAGAYAQDTVTGGGGQVLEGVITNDVPRRQAVGLPTSGCPPFGTQLKLDLTPELGMSFFEPHE
jgi:hypothetical protein